ncbi:MAG: hypothetical protein WC889_02930 [Myxococcota bacterium]|jgi:hypothetical protein
MEIDVSPTPDAKPFRLALAMALLGIVTAGGNDETGDQEESDTGNGGKVDRDALDDVHAAMLSEAGR